MSAGVVGDTLRVDHADPERHEKRTQCHQTFHDRRVHPEAALLLRDQSYVHTHAERSLSNTLPSGWSMPHSGHPYQDSCWASFGESARVLAMA